jgi:hypothetical protein
MAYTTRTALAVAGLALALAASTASAQQTGTDMGKGTVSMNSMNVARTERTMAGWPKASREAATFMTKKYGAPAATTAEMAVWGKTGPWKRTVVFAREYAHEFPAHHTDVMQQWVDYKAAPATYDELAMYDGSVVLERTSGEMSARCDMEGANFLALNLAHDIATGKQTVEGARKMYGEQIVAMKAGRSAPYTERLMFGMMSNTADPDRPAGMALTGSRQ